MSPPQSQKPSGNTTRHAKYGFKKLVPSLLVKDQVAPLCVHRKAVAGRVANKEGIKTRKKRRFTASGVTGDRWRVEW